MFFQSSTGLNGSFAECDFCFMPAFGKTPNKTLNVLKVSERLNVPCTCVREANYTGMFISSLFTHAIDSLLI